jgi:hypothetical protein
MEATVQAKSLYDLREKVQSLHVRAGAAASWPRSRPRSAGQSVAASDWAKITNPRNSKPN